MAIRAPRRLVVLAMVVAAAIALTECSSGSTPAGPTNVPSTNGSSTPPATSTGPATIIMQEDGEDRLIMIRRAKTTLDDSKLRPTERDKIRAAKRHFEGIGIDDYSRAIPGAWTV